MRRLLRAAVTLLFCLFLAPMLKAQADTPGAKDYPGITRMPGYLITEYKTSGFDSYTFKVTEGKKDKDQAVEGRRFDYRYDLSPKGAPASALQIIRNYQNAARAAGGQVLREAGDGNDRATTLRFTKAGSEVWIALRALGGVDKIYFLTIIEKEAMRQEVVMDAAAMAGSIADTGSVAIYGIHFDTAMAEIKPDSAPAIAEIAKLLKSSPALQVFVVGHTDMVGDANTNQMLSQRRAQAVINELITRFGISDARLTARGMGPYAPVGSNRNEEGRARNRRVELVEIATSR